MGLDFHPKQVLTLQSGTIGGMVSPQPAPTLAEIRSKLDARVPQMVAQLERLVNAESPSLNIERLEHSARVLAEIITEVTGKAPEIIASPAGPHVHWKGSDDTKVLLVGHHDTVFPLGEVAVRQFSRYGDVVHRLDSSAKAVGRFGIA